MWKQKLGMSVFGSSLEEMSEIIGIVKRVGFDAVSPEYKKGIDLSEVISVARECGLIVQSVHAPYGEAADMWSDGDSGRAATEEILSVLKTCRDCSVPVMVLHTWIGFDYKFDDSSLYYDNYDRVVATAEEYGVKVAFENTEGEEFLFALMHRYDSRPAVGFCWDSGHEMCYNHSMDLLDKLGDRLIMTHLNDNLGISRFDGRVFWTDDLHLLPYDGIADWDYNVARLKKSAPQTILNFELNPTSKPSRHDNDVYSFLSIELYLTEAYKRACRIAYRYSADKN